MTMDTSFLSYHKLLYKKDMLFSKRLIPALLLDKSSSDTGFVYMDTNNRS